MSEGNKKAITPERRKRINRLKKMIVYTVLMLVMIPIAGCVILGIMLYKTRNSVNIMSSQVQELQASVMQYADEADRAQALLEINEEIRRESIVENPSDVIAVGMQAENPAQETVESTPEESGIREVYLTFDDGPSIYTNRILDILAEYDVKATFFVTGKEDYGDVYRRIVEEGHTLGMHSYSHKYGSIYASLWAFQQDMEKLRDFLYTETGVASRYYRFPGGSSNAISGKNNMQDMIDYLNAMDITYFDWNISAGDASSGGISSSQIVSRVMRELPSHQVAVVLLHDAGDKYSTVEALPSLIEQIQGLGENTEILPITEDTMPVQHVQSNKLSLNDKNSLNNKEKNTEEN